MTMIPSAWDSSNIEAYAAGGPAEERGQDEEQMSAEDVFPRFDVGGQVALVTGAARGLGSAIATALAHAGADVALGVRDPATGGDVAAAVEEQGREVITVPLDVTDLSQIDNAVARVVDRFGRLDILVNNAGLGPENPAELVTEADFDLTFDVNVKGLFFISQAAGRVMIERGYGRIVNLSSQAGLVALPTESIYCASKAAVSHLTRCLAVEWGPQGVNVNAVAPTFIRTPGTEAALSDPTFRTDVVERIAALHRIGEPVDVTGAVVYLASPAAALVTGTTLVVDGGWTVR
jgi:NAD(P)-dependent dehydrogenase (short-subunit alcohol dehydrogenase family)